MILSGTRFFALRAELRGEAVSCDENEVPLKIKKHVDRIIKKQ
jgi:hypothetical protein